MKELVCIDMNELDTLTERGAVFKGMQNTFNKMWRRLPVALGVQFLEDKLAICTVHTVLFAQVHIGAFHV